MLVYAALLPIRRLFCCCTPGRWFSTADAYEVKYELRYEPWVMCDRRSVPWHDNTFKGYGLNKIMHLEHMSSLGYR